MYNQLQEKLASKYSKLPNFKADYQLAYSQAVSMVGEENAYNLEQALIGILDSIFERYIESKPKTRGGKLFRVLVKIASFLLPTSKRK
jgi:hypothetical protein